MPGLTSYSQQIIDAILRAQPLSFPTDGVDMALHTADPGPDCTNAEVQGGSYIRVHVPIELWDANVNGICRLNGTLDWPEATEAWGMVTHASFWDGNNPWFRGQFETARNISSGSTFHVDADNALLGIQ